MNELIQYHGISDLTPEQKEVVQKLSTDYHDKIRRSLHDDTSLIVHLKVYKKAGEKEKPGEKKGRVKYALHCKAISPNGVFDSTKAHDWELPKVLHMGFRDLLAQIEHTTKKHPIQGKKKRMKIIR